MCDGADLQGLSMCNELEPAFTAGPLACTVQCVYDLSGCSGDLCQWSGLYGNGWCDPCELYGGTPDPDCASCTVADGDCVSWIAPYLVYVALTIPVLVLGCEEPASDSDAPDAEAGVLEDAIVPPDVQTEPDAGPPDAGEPPVGVQHDFCDLDLFILPIGGPTERVSGYSL